MTRRLPRALLLSLLLSLSLGPAALPGRADDEPPGQDEPEEEEKKEEKQPDEPKKEAPKQDDEAARKELEERLAAASVVRPSVSSDGTVTLHYPLLERKEATDFEAKGLDTFGVEKVHVQGRDPITGLEVGAGSRGAGRVLHELTWLEDFEVRFKVQVLVSPQSALFCLVLGKKVGVLWGQRLVRASNLKPLTKDGKLDRNAFKEGRVVEVHVVRAGTKLTVSCDGLPTDTVELTKGELDGGIQIGFVAKNVRLVINGWTIKGKVDPKKVP